MQDINERDLTVMHKLCRMVPQRSVLIAGLVLALGGTAHCQYATGRLPQVDLAGTYSFVRANSANFGAGFSLNGGSFSVAYSVNNRFSAIADVGVYRFPELPMKTTSAMYTYLFGPRIILSRSSRAMPFAQILVGGGRLNASSSGIAAGESTFAVAIGGGLDVPFRSRYTVRVAQADYLITRFANGSGSPATQNNFRISAGLVIRLGGK